MQKLNKFLKDTLAALLSIWLLTVTLVTIDQAASEMFGWKQVFRISVKG